MPEFDAVEAKILLQALARFRDSIDVELAQPLGKQLRGYQPPALSDLYEELNLVQQQLGAGEAPYDVHELHARILKTVVTRQRRARAFEIDEPRRRTGHREAIRYLTKELRVLDGIVQAPWFSEVVPARLPRLTDYVSVRFAEEASEGAPGLAPRVFDEKFHILEAPTSFLPDLAHYRRRCELRERPVAVVFIDIDDFKGFNSRYGETRVDRDVLPAFMERLESHVFAHGHAYRFGGDEYLLLLPNAATEYALALVHEVQRALASLSLPGIEAPPTISAGICPVGPMCMLTDREVQEHANRAKNVAKAAGKRRVAWYAGELYRDEDISLDSGP